MNEILPLIGSVIAVVWGIAHIFPVRLVVSGFGPLSRDNRFIILMEWVSEGLALIFIGVLCACVTLYGGSPESHVRKIVYLASAGMLLVMAVWTFFTGTRTSILPMKLCPWMKTLAALLIGSGLSG